MVQKIHRPSAIMSEVLTVWAERMVSVTLFVFIKAESIVSSNRLGVGICVIICNMPKYQMLRHLVF